MTGDRGDSLKEIAVDGYTVDVCEERLGQILDANGITLIAQPDQPIRGRAESYNERFPNLGAGVPYDSYVPWADNGLEAGRGPQPARHLDAIILSREFEHAMPVYLVVTVSGGEERPQERHWSIRWQTRDGETKDRGGGWLYTPLYARNLGLYYNYEFAVPAGRARQYVNWGPVTKECTFQTGATHRGLRLGALAPADRRELEAVARNTPIAHVAGAGVSNCQNWALAVAWVAVRRGIGSLREETVRAAFVEAMREDPQSSDGFPFTPAGRGPNPLIKEGMEHLYE